MTAFMLALEREMPRMSRRIRLALLGAVICAIAAPASAQQLFNN